jgi:exosortase A-associated hydrolase 2
MRPFHLVAADGARLFAVYWPATDTALHQAVLILPPFGEEMNKCRPMLAAQARAFAAVGLHVLMVDLFGTGDSDGEFAEARWQRWLQDLKDARQWLLAEQRVAAVHLLAARAGALFAPALLEPGSVAAGSGKLMLWQPVLKGSDAWRQLLRMRLMADNARGHRGSSSELELQLAREGSLEIGGYTVAAALGAELGAAQLDAAALQDTSAVLWAEVAASEPPALSTAGARICQQWTQAGVRLESTAVCGEPFWSTPEIGWARALLQPTSTFAARTPRQRA